MKDEDYSINENILLSISANKSHPFGCPNNILLISIYILLFFSIIIIARYQQFYKLFSQESAILDYILSSILDQQITT